MALLLRSIRTDGLADTKDCDAANAQLSPRQVIGATLAASRLALRCRRVLTPRTTAATIRPLRLH